MRIDRLLEIVMILVNKKRATAKELSARLGVSVRTIYRDIDALSLAGIPVYSSAGNGGGIGLLESFTMDKSFLSEKDREDIIFALQSLSAARYPGIESTLGKMKTIFKNTANEDWIEVDFSHWGSGGDEKARFTTLKDAILARRVLEFDYVNSSGEPSARVTEPLKLRYKGNAWYLRAYCRNKKDFRVFRVTRMHGLKTLDEIFDRRATGGAREESTRIDPALFVTLKLKIAKEAAHRVYDDFLNGPVIRDENGDFIVTMRYLFDEWVIGYLLSFGSSLEVLEPDHVREIIKRRAENIVKNYLHAEDGAKND